LSGGRWGGKDRGRPKLGRRHRSHDLLVLVKTAGTHVLRLVSHGAGLVCLREWVPVDVEMSCGRDGGRRSGRVDTLSVLASPRQNNPRQEAVNEPTLASLVYLIRL
jgi:hypothetical protein